MPYKTLTPEGKKFILTQINKSAVLFKNTEIKDDKTAYYNNLILWIEKYSKKYDLDSNILSAQIYQESKFYSGAYNVNPKTKKINAMGITQFLLITINDVIFGRFKSEFTQIERDAISKNIVLNSKGEINGSLRPTLFKNVANNPEIMIKAQAVYMRKGIADRIKSDLASVTLYGYNRGPAFIKENYSDTVLTYFNKNLDKKVYEKTPKTDPKTYINPPTEGTRYVQKIFDLLKSYFGYKNLDNSIDLDKLGFGNA